MKQLEILMIGVGLSMDAFAVSIGKGLSKKCIRLKEVIGIAMWFGMFQFFMPVIGYWFGTFFREYVERFDHWIAFTLLLWIGVHMIYEACQKEVHEEKDDMSIPTMLPLAIATSIDALAVGISFAFFKKTIFLSAILIGIITFFLSALGVLMGSKLGSHFGKQSELIGGMILVIIGIKILVEHLID